MKALRPGVNIDAFFGGLRRAPGRVLMLDYDGTLAPFHEARDRAVPYPGVRERLAALISATHTRVVVVSGRAIGVLRPLLAVRPEPEIWGSHGWEHYAPGQGLECADPGLAARRGLDEALAAAHRIAPPDAVERKPVSVAVHVRGRAEAEGRDLLEAVRAPWTHVAAAAALVLHDFDGGLEIRAPGRDKGTSVRAILETEPAGTAAAFLGDDLTDEDAFRALAGVGLRVLVRDQPRPTEADLWLRPPEELLRFLDRWNRSATPE